MDNKTIGKETFDITPREEFFEDTKEKRQSLPRQKRKYNRTFRITDEEGVCKTYSMDRKVSYMQTLSIGLRIFKLNISLVLLINILLSLWLLLPI